MLAGKTVFCCVWHEMGQQQLPQQPVLRLLCPVVGHLRVALQISLGLSLGAVRAAHGVWGIGKCLAGMGARRLQSFCRVVFPPVPTVPVQSGCGAVPLPVTPVPPFSRRSGWVDPSSFLATSLCHCIFRLYPKAHKKPQLQYLEQTCGMWHGMAGLKPHQKNAVFFLPGWSGPPTSVTLALSWAFGVLVGGFLVGFFA